MECDLEAWISALVEDKEYKQRKQKVIGDQFDSIENCIDLK